MCVKVADTSWATFPFYWMSFEWLVESSSFSIIAAELESDEVRADP